VQQTLERVAAAAVVRARVRSTLVLVLASWNASPAFLWEHSVRYGPENAAENAAADTAAAAVALLLAAASIVMTLAVQERATEWHVALGCIVRILDVLVSEENKIDQQLDAVDLLLIVFSSFPHRLLLLLSDSDGENWRDLPASASLVSRNRQNLLETGGPLLLLLLLSPPDERWRQRLCWAHHRVWAANSIQTKNWQKLLPMLLSVMMVAASAAASAAAAAVALLLATEKICHVAGWRLAGWCPPGSASHPDRVHLCRRVRRQSWWLAPRELCGGRSTIWQWFSGSCLTDLRGMDDFNQTNVYVCFFCYLREVKQDFLRHVL
jgi:hypothetical protein